MNWSRKFMSVAAACLLGMTTLSGCGQDISISDTKVVLTTGLGKEDVFRIDTAVCTLPELMVYLTTTQNRYEQVYGSEIWQVSMGTETLEDSIKETVLAEIAQIKSMYLLAEQKGIVLTEEEALLVSRAADEYMGSLSTTEQELLGVDLAIVESMYTEYLLANKVYQAIIEGVNPEISDDEARRVTIQHIWLKNYLEDGAGNKIRLTDEQQADLYEEAMDIWELATGKGWDFEQLASKYSDGETITYSLGMGEQDIAIEDVVFAMETEEISDIIETDTGYHIIRCVNTLDREETDANKLKIAKQRRNEAFSKEYDSFIETLTRKLNQKLWDKIAFIDNAEVDTVEFFDIYNKYLATESE